MRKHFYIAAIACLASASSQAATVLGFDVGAYAWQTDLTAKQNGMASDDSTDSKVNPVIFAALEHPIPILPNVRVTQTSLKNDMDTSSVDASHTDLTLYYEVLDNIVSLDLGFAGRKHDGSVKDNSDSSIDTTFAMGYGKLQFDLPVTGLGLGAEIYKGTGNSDQKVTDINAFIQYNVFMGFNLGAGYRRLDTDIEINKDIVNLKFDGAYISAFYHF